MIPDTWLAALQAIPPGCRRSNRAVASCGGLEALASLSTRELARHGLPAAGIARLAQPDTDLMGRWRRWLNDPGCDLIAYGCAEYPARLAELPDAPAALWARGRDTRLLCGPQLAMVGSRHPTAGGLATAESFAATLSLSGVTITSGLALGIDGASHRGALTGPGATVAVLGAGIDSVYPRSNADLAAKITEQALIVSEYPPGTPVRRNQFPARNRIIAGLSLGVLVVEATRRSGSLITARLAAEYGREVFALPGSIHSPLSRGCHALIRAGALLVERVDEMLCELAPQLTGLCDTAQEALTGVQTQRPECAKLLDLLGFEPVGSDELAARAGLTAAELSSMLLLLEMDGAVEALPGARYCRVLKRS